MYIEILSNSPTFETVARSGIKYDWHFMHKVLGMHMCCYHEQQHQTLPMNPSMSLVSNRFTSFQILIKTYSFQLDVDDACISKNIHFP